MIIENLIKDLRSQAFMSILIDGKNEAGIHFLILKSWGISDIDEEIIQEEELSSTSELVEEIWNDLVKLGYSSPQTIVTLWKFDEEDRYWFYDGISESLTYAIYGTPEEQNRELEIWANE